MPWRDRRVVIAGHPPKTYQEEQGWWIPVPNPRARRMRLASLDECECECVAAGPLVAAQAS